MSRLTSTDTTLCASYGLFALGALVSTQVILVKYLSSEGGSLVEDVFANGAATFATIDLLVVALVALVFMVVEGRRLGVRFLWVYVVLTFAVAISVSLPLFLIARQFRLAAQRTPQQAQPA